MDNAINPEEFHRSSVFRLIVLALSVGLCTAAPGTTLVTWDFTEGPHGWTGNQHVAGLAVSSQGLTFSSTGIDPWIEGPAIDLPGDGLTRVRVRMKSDADPHGELFYGRTFRAGHSVRFTVQDDGRWHEYSLLIREPLGSNTRFRLDPATRQGHVTIASMQIETLPQIRPPQPPRPQRPSRGTAAPMSVSTVAMTLEHYGGHWGDFEIKIGGEAMAAGYQAERIGLAFGEEVQWLDLGEAEFTRTRGKDGEVVCRVVVEDGRAGRWEVTRRFKAGTHAGTIVVETEFAVDADREVIHLPWLTLFPGLGTFGRQKSQGLFAGLEYLADEPSSSEADISTPEHVRRVPDAVKITFPLMAVAQGGRYVAVIWELADHVAAVFDSPDTIYKSGAHLMALTAPAVGEKRFENDLVAHTPFTLPANRPSKARIVITGGRGKTVAPAIAKYVELRGLPNVPEFKGGFAAAVTLLAHGWLDSAINEGGIFRHAVWGESFRAGAAGDAPMYIDWLAHHAQDPNLVGRLGKERDRAMTKIPPGQPYVSTVSHTRTPSAPFVFGAVHPYVERRRAEARNLLRNFDEQGIKLYRPGKVDYGRTHFAKHANGHAGADVVRVLEAATLSADPELIERGLALLDKQTALYAGTVPRGAQVWEVPLHTPDILASARMVKAYTLGYIISDRQEHLEQARYWAWTGVPFVYLANPTEGEVGPYATIAVLGATNWRAPSWFGRPVQWCGLVYGSALHLLSEYDREGPWETIAKGITAAGLQMTWPVTDHKRQGLLPDFFYLREQISDGPAINPGTVQAHVPELFGRGRLYDVKRLARKGWFIHAPCRLRRINEKPDEVTLVADGWDNKTCSVLFSGLESEPAEVNVRRASEDRSVRRPYPRAHADFKPEQRLLAVTVAGTTEIQIRY